MNGPIWFAATPLFWRRNMTFSDEPGIYIRENLECVWRTTCTSPKMGRNSLRHKVRRLEDPFGSA